LIFILALSRYVAPELDRSTSKTTTAGSPD